MQDTIELIVERDGQTTRLLSPGVGAFTCAVQLGALLGGGQDAGVLIDCGRPLYLRVPEGISGRVSNARPEKVHAPVGYRSVLYELSSIEAGAGDADESEAASEAQGLYLRAPQTGRFYHRPSPDEEAFIQAGDEVGDGHAIGLIEVMKTFAHVTYHPTAGLPTRAKVLRYVAGDGAEVREGEPLVEFES